MPPLPMMQYSFELGGCMVGSQPVINHQIDPHLGHNALDAFVDHNIHHLDGPVKSLEIGSTSILNALTGSTTDLIW